MSGFLDLTLLDTAGKDILGNAGTADTRPQVQLDLAIKHVEGAWG